MATEARPPVLSLRDVHAGYSEVNILNGVDLDVAAGEVVCVIGANGAGKSTLLKTVFGLVRLAAGRIVLDGVDVTKADSGHRLRAGIVIVPQGRCNFPRMSVQENLEMGGFTLGKKQVADGIRTAFQTFEVLERKQRVPAGNLSGGEQQLLEMAMALMLRPKVVLIDEPSLGLAHGMQQRVFQSLRVLADQGVGVLLVEQNAVQALRASDRGVVVERGRISCQGSGVEMLEDPVVRRAYLGLAV